MDFHEKCRALLAAYRAGELGQTRMPEDAHPEFPDRETRLCYFTLPMALNYQRDSYKLWEAALAAYNDPETREIFSVKNSAKMEERELREKLTKHKVALQPNKHVQTWKKIAETIYQNWETMENLLSGKDYLKLKEIIQGTYKKGFPYLSGPKIFNYWSFIIGEYGGTPLANRGFIEIAPDTHVTKCSVLLGLLTEEEASALSKETISEKWRIALEGSGIAPIDMHPPLWFWSRNGFKIKKEITQL